MFKTDSYLCTINRYPPSGAFLLDGSVSARLEVQTTLADFRESFENRTSGVLDGLEWSNVFIAGGMVLRAMHLFDPSESFKDSDIDLFIYGLHPVQANIKVKHIFEVWRSNLPQGTDHRILRNQRTITFVPPL